MKQKRIQNTIFIAKHEADCNYKSNTKSINNGEDIAMRVQKKKQLHNKMSIQVDMELCNV